MDPITFGVIGSGFMGGVLAHTASELPYARCVGAADTALARAETLGQALGCKAYGSYEEMLDREKPDAVIIATPEDSHREPALAAAAHGCHIFMEKPLATSLQDADSIIEACAHHQVKLMMGHVLRFEINYAMIESAIREGTIGRLLSAYARRITPISEAHRLAGRVSPISYIAVHDIDQILWYHPRPVRSVYARAVRGRVWEELHTFDSAWVTIEFVDGALGIQEVGWALPEGWAGWDTPVSWGGFGDVCMNVLGTEGVLNLNFTPMDLYAVTRDGWKLPDTRHWPKMDGKYVGAVKLELEHFLGCILDGTEPRVTGGDGRRSVEIMLAAEVSIAEDRVVPLPL
jgi:UDP-N-acetylglucosamine 3-dehydrogenase